MQCDLAQNIWASNLAVPSSYTSDISQRSVVCPCKFWLAATIVTRWPWQHVHSIQLIAIIVVHLCLLRATLLAYDYVAFCPLQSITVSTLQYPLPDCRNQKMKSFSITVTVANDSPSHIWVRQLHVHGLEWRCVPASPGTRGAVTWRFVEGIRRCHMTTSLSRYPARVIGTLPHLALGPPPPPLLLLIPPPPPHPFFSSLLLLLLLRAACCLTGEFQIRVRVAFSHVAACLNYPACSCIAIV